MMKSFIAVMLVMALAVASAAEKKDYNHFISKATKLSRGFENLEGVFAIKGFSLRSVSSNGERRNLKATSDGDFGDKLDLQFEAFDQKFELDLDRHDMNMHKEATVTTLDEAGNKVTRKANRVSYRGQTQYGGWARATVYDTDKVHLNFYHNGEVHTIEPIMKQKDHANLMKSPELAGSSHVAYKLFDREELSPQMKANLVMPRATRMCEASAGAQKFGEKIGTDETCDFGKQKTVNMHAYIDKGYYDTVTDGYTGNDPEGFTLAKIQTIFDMTNVVYSDQLNVFLSIGHFELRTTSNTLLTSGIMTTLANRGSSAAVEAWNQEPKNRADIEDQGATACGGSCGCQAAQANLDVFGYFNVLQYYFAANPPSNEAALVHVFTNCYNIGSSGGTVGIAQLGAVCNSMGQGGTTGVGFTTFVQGQTFWTFAHEVGHNFDMQHTWEVAGVGDNKHDGTIMSYDPNKIFQFSTQYSTGQACMHLNTAESRCNSNQFHDYTPTCGNGVIEAGEDCDDDSSCCDNCRFPEGAYCSGECCTNDCKFETFGTLCESKCGDFRENLSKGVCSNGACTVLEVTKKFVTSGVTTCEKKDAYTGGCKEAFGWPDYGFDGVSVCLSADQMWGSVGSHFPDRTGLFAPDGTVCDASGKTCVSGSCTGGNYYDSHAGGSEFGAGGGGGGGKPCETK